MSEAPIQKICSGCVQPLPLESFGKAKRYKLGRRSRCLLCDRRYGKEWRRQNPGRKRWRDSHREEDRANNAAYHIRKTYGVTAEEWRSMLDAQGGRCANPGCRTDMPGGRAGKFYLDHDHKTGKVRGLLCWGCNISAGHLKDNPVAIRGLASYVESGGYVPNG